eukprot:9376776-Alexandrium_andersonii.AAC.1
MAATRHAACWAMGRRRIDGRRWDTPCPALPPRAFRGEKSRPAVERRWLSLDGRPATYAEFLAAFRRLEAGPPDAPLAAADA